MNPYLSVVFPAYNEQQRIGNALFKTADFFKEWNQQIEIIIVENGSTDETMKTAVDACLEISRETNNLVFRFESTDKGKGNACRWGLKVARGYMILITDVDLSTPIIESTMLLAKIVNGGYDLAVGSRKLPNSVVCGMGSRRKLTSGAFSGLAGLLTPGIKDTQCGFKLLTKRSAEMIEPLLTIGGFAWDVELIHVAIQLGLDVVEVPVSWTHDARSTVNVGRDSLLMARDLINIGLASALGEYS